MYLKHITIKNSGAIENLSFCAGFTDENNPKPIVIVGENGTGKTILLSSIIDSFYEIAGNLFDDVKKQSGLKTEYFKIQGGGNVRQGADKSLSFVRYKSLELDKELEFLDYINISQDDISDLKVSQKLQELISKLPSDINQNKYTTQLNNKERQMLQLEWMQQVHFYQPAYRYEEPFWKNESFYTKETFNEQKQFRGRYDKELELVNSLQKNRSFLMDVVLDNQIYPSENGNLLWRKINEILRAIKQNSSFRFGIGPRNSGYRIGVVRSDGELYLPNISQLSLGEILLLNMFVNIIRHTDKSNLANAEVKGIVAIDEVDVHLHTIFQCAVLPELIATFPKVQFILSTHSPLFVLGMRDKFGDEGFDLIEMPSGDKITAERFREFEAAFKAFADTKKFEDKIKQEVENSHLPLVFVEGKYDIKYIEKICELFDKQDILKKIKLCDGGGFENLNKIWKSEQILFKNLAKKILLLYDCDTKVENKEKGNVVKRMIPPQETLFDRGIENLFSKETILRVMKNNPKFIDKVTINIERGKEKIIIETYKVNDDEKGNLCDYMCQNGSKEDFENFKIVLEIINKFLKNTDGNAVKNA